LQFSILALVAVNAAAATIKAIRVAAIAASGFGFVKIFFNVILVYSRETFYGNSRTVGQDQS
jgi:hypothetical protein